MEIVTLDPVHKPVFLADAPRTGTGELEAQGLGLSESLEGTPLDIPNKLI